MGHNIRKRKQAGSQKEFMTNQMAPNGTPESVSNSFPARITILLRRDKTVPRPQNSTKAPNISGCKLLSNSQPYTTAIVSNACLQCNSIQRSCKADGGQTGTHPVCLLRVGTVITDVDDHTGSSRLVSATCSKHSTLCDCQRLLVAGDKYSYSVLAPKWWELACTVAHGSGIAPGRTRGQRETGAEEGNTFFVSWREHVRVYRPCKQPARIEEHIDSTKNLHKQHEV